MTTKKQVKSHPKCKVCTSLYRHEIESMHSVGYSTQDIIRFVENNYKEHYNPASYYNHFKKHYDPDNIDPVAVAKSAAMGAIPDTNELDSFDQDSFLAKMYEASIDGSDKRLLDKINVLNHMAEGFLVKLEKAKNDSDLPIEIKLKLSSEIRLLVDGMSKVQKDLQSKPQIQVNILYQATRAVTKAMGVIVRRMLPGREQEFLDALQQELTAEAGISENIVDAEFTDIPREQEIVSIPSSVEVIENDN